MSKNRYVNVFLLWVGVAISIAEIVTGTLIAPLGWAKGSLAIILGHVIGCFVFLLPAAYLSAHHHKSAIGVVGLIFGKWGVKLFALLNAIQLVGWTAVMIVNAQVAMNGLSAKLFHFRSVIGMSVVITVLIIVWLLLKHDWLFKINNAVVLLLAVGMLILVWVLATGKGAAVPATDLGEMSFGAAVELSVTMSLSWLPLIGDYTQNENRRPLKFSLASVSGYFLASCFMFMIGLITVIHTGQTDFTAALVNTNLGLVALFIIVFSTVTTTFMAAYSAAQNIQTLAKKGNINWLAVGVMLIGLALATLVSLSNYENFLYLIGAVFTPLFTILFVSAFVLRRRLSLSLNFTWWLVGTLGYYELQKFDFAFGTTFLLLLLLGLGVYLTGLLTKKYPLAEQAN